MCGIAGIIADERLVRRALPPMTLAQRHRGPDDSGEEYLPFGDRYLGLGHRRLSILDLTMAGHQPMKNPRTGDLIVFNGEIYNFISLRKELEAAGEQFIGHCDTEVLLYGLSRWGTEYLKRLAGMYALGFYDAHKGQLILARDPLGIKPLYVAEYDGLVMFASEVRAILAAGAVKPALDGQGVGSYLAYGAVQQPSTIVEGIRSFPPGNWQVFGADGGASPGPKAFWDYPRVGTPINTEVRAAEAIREVLDTAVREHMVADVPVGVFLSSGLDSTIITGLAARHTSRLRTFTVGFVDQPDMSELALAKETARQFEVDHTEVLINGTDAEAAAVEWFEALDQPSVDGLNVFVISKAVRRLGITVALSGQGGDELFGGYPSFMDVPRLRWWTRRLAWLPSPMRRGLFNVAAAQRPEAVRLKLGDIFAGKGDLADIYFHRRRALSRRQLARLGVEAAKLGLKTFHSPAALAGSWVDERDPVASVSRLESAFYQGNMLLRDGDANGMAHSLEIRVPLLDQRVVDLVSALPGSLRLPYGRANKHLLRVAFSSFLRPELLAMGKRGFTLPIARWMIGPLRDLCEESLKHLKSVGVLEARGIDAIWGAFLLEPESPIWSRAFMLVVFGRYLRNVGIAG